MATIAKNLERQLAKGILTEEAKEATLANITTVTDLQTGVENVDLIIEAATENIELKIFKD